jgi:hypothetical protein
MAIFTRRHYVAIARMIRDRAERSPARGEPGGTWYYVALDDIARDLADFFQEDNPRFDRDRFLVAAGIPIGPKEPPEAFYYPRRKR